MDGTPDWNNLFRDQTFSQLTGADRMKSLLATSILSIVLLAPLTASADGLIYQLPEDGTSLTFDWKGSFERQGQTEEMSGVFRISSVGKETVDDQPCRWIEFKLTMNTENRVRTIHAKVLVPESELAKGKSPIDHIRKAWYKPGDSEPQEITDFTSGRAGPLPAFLSGPLVDVQVKESVSVKSGLGEHKCKVTTGSTSFEQSGGTQKFIFTNHAHKDAPFGLIKSDIRLEMERNGAAAGSGRMTFIAKEVEKDAKPVIPNGK